MIWEFVKAGLLALEDYVALHVLTCLLPAFLLAGGLVAFVNREDIQERLRGLEARFRECWSRNAAPAFSPLNVLEAEGCLALATGRKASEVWLWAYCGS